MTKNETGTDEIEIDLLQLAEVLLRRAKIIIATVLLVAAAAFGITYYLITPLYTSTALMYVNNSSFSVGSTSFSISSAELTAAKSLVDTYVVILKSRNTLEDVIRQENLDYTYEQLYSMIDSQAVNATEIFEINVTSPSAAEAEHIANALAGILPDKIASIVEGSDVRIVDYAVIPAERTSPSYTINTVIGALVGLVFACAVVIMRYLFDESIRSEDYLTQTYPNIPLLAVVPDMMHSGKSDKYGGYYGSGRSGSSGGEKTTERKSAPAPSNRAASRPAKSGEDEARRPAPERKRAPAAPQTQADAQAAASRPTRPARPAGAERATARPVNAVKKGENESNG